MTGKELFLPLLFDLFVVINFAENYRPREEGYIISWTVWRRKYSCPKKWTEIFIDALLYYNNEEGKRLVFRLSC